MLVVLPKQDFAGGVTKRSPQVQEFPGQSSSTVQVQAPLTHSPLGHVVPQATQLLGSVARFTHVPVQQVSPAPQPPQQSVAGMHPPLQHCCPPPQEPHNPPQPFAPQILPAQFGVQTGGDGGVVDLLRFFFRFRLASTSSWPRIAGSPPTANAPSIDVSARRV
jgi:hypothetical protein